VPVYLIYLFCASVGFAAAGAITFFYQMGTSETADFATEWHGWWAALVAVLLSMFGGPFILAAKFMSAQASVIPAPPAPETVLASRLIRASRVGNLP